MKVISRVKMDKIESCGGSRSPLNLVFDAIRKLRNAGRLWRSYLMTTTGS